MHLALNKPYAWRLLLSKGELQTVVLALQHASDSNPTSMSDQQLDTAEKLARTLSEIRRKAEASRRDAPRADRRRDADSDADADETDDIDDEDQD